MKNADVSKVGNLSEKWPYICIFLIIQGVQDQKCQKEKARTWKGSIFDPTLVKPKWV